MQPRSNPLHELARLGQSVWLDGVNRPLLRSGRLQRLLESDGLTGLKSNPVPFEQAVKESDVYAADIQRLAREGRSVEQICDLIVIADIQEAADLLHPVYERTQRRDGYVSLEVSPHLAHKTGATVAEARRLWEAVERPNLLIEVPATLAGIRAVRQLIAEGINVNATFLFDLLRFREVLDAWISGLDDRIRRSSTVDQVACVAGFCLSSMDALVDPLLERAAAQRPEDADRVWQLRGQTAVAQAKVAHVIWQRFLAGFRFAKLVEKGAQPLRLLWSGTELTNPDYSDIKYVEPLIASGTIVALPMKTLEAYRKQGHPAVRIEEGLDTARRMLYELHKGRLELHEVAHRLEDEGVGQAMQAHDALLNAIRSKCREALRPGSGRSHPGTEGP